MNNEHTTETLTPRENTMNKATTERTTAINTIAKDILDIETLETQHSDSLDFHDIPVWKIAEALKQAYWAGRHHERGL